MERLDGCIHSVLEEHKSTAESIRSISGVNPVFYNVVYEYLPHSYDAMIYDLSKGIISRRKKTEGENIELALTYHYLNLVKELNSMIYTYEKLKNAKKQ